MTNHIALAAALLLTNLPPKTPTIHKKIPNMHQGALALKQIHKSLVIPPSQHTNTFQWKYSNGIVPSNYWWNIEQKIGSNAWTVIQSNVTGIPQLNIPKTNNGFIRLHGRTTK